MNDSVRKEVGTNKYRDKPMTRDIAAPLTERGQTKCKKVTRIQFIFDLIYLACLILIRGKHKK